MTAPDPGTAHRLLMPADVIEPTDSWVYNIQGTGWAVAWSPGADPADVGKTLAQARYSNPGGHDLWYRRPRPTALCGCGHHDVYADDDLYAQHREWLADEDPAA